MTDIIIKKRDGGELSKEEIDFFVSGVTDGSVPDYQISALLMAMLLVGMSDRETVLLTLAMAESGDMLDLSSLGDKTVDKHSTGGVGDKTTPIVASVAAALGCTVAKMSGRGLGHTGGTTDKLESIDGYRTDITEEEFLRNAAECGMCLAGHSGNLTPADKRLYAIRDVTGTVESIPLIAASVMSKKLAAGAKHIVLDVKYGSGAFMKTPESAEELAKEMVKIGKSAGRKMTALITNMDIPIGFAVGNSLEIREAVSVLKGEGPSDLTELCTELAAAMYRSCFDCGYDEAVNSVKEAIKNGRAFETFVKAVKLQGGDVRLITGERDFPNSESSREIFAESDGYITSMDCEAVGRAACISGAGREKKDDVIDLSAGIILKKKTGDYVNQGEPLATVYGGKNRISEAAETLFRAYKIGSEKPKQGPLIYKVIK